MPKLEPGTIIQDTNLNRDIIPALLGVWRTMDATRCAIFETANAPEIARLGADDLTPDEYEYQDWLRDEIERELQDFVPDDCYLGAHPGDGSDLGVWLIQRDDEDDPMRGDPWVEAGPED